MKICAPEEYIIDYLMMCYMPILLGTFLTVMILFLVIGFFVVIFSNDEEEDE